MSDSQQHSPLAFRVVFDVLFKNYLLILIFCAIGAGVAFWVNSTVAESKATYSREFFFQEDQDQCLVLHEVASDIVKFHKAKDASLPKSIRNIGKIKFDAEQECLFYLEVIDEDSSKLKEIDQALLNVVLSHPLQRAFLNRGNKVEGEPEKVDYLYTSEIKVNDKHSTPTVRIFVVIVFLFFMIGYAISWISYNRSQRKE